MFEYDSRKSKVNAKKHGISFEETYHLWNDPYLIRVRAKNVEGEERFAYIGLIEDNYWTAIATIRNDKIRLISCRRARKNEKVIYDEKKQKL